MCLQSWDGWCVLHLMAAGRAQLLLAERNTATSSQLRLPCGLPAWSPGSLQGGLQGSAARLAMFADGGHLLPASNRPTPLPPLCTAGLLDRVAEVAAAHGLTPFDSSLEQLHNPAINAAFNTKGEGQCLACAQ